MAVMILLKDSLPELPNAAKRAVSSESIETNAAIRLITFAAESTGLLYLLYRLF